MSHTHQDETSTRPQPTTTPKAPRVTQRTLTSESTPATKKQGAEWPYSYVENTLEKVRYDLEKEMQGRWLGAMPVDTFLAKYVPTSEALLPDVPENTFKSVPSDGAENKRYDSFIAAIEGWMPHLQAINTSAKEDTVNNLNLKPDISIYNRVEGVAPPDRTDFSRIELWMEFKANKHGAAFQDPRNEKERRSAIETGSFTPDTEKGIEMRGQLAHYAGAQHSLQFRHFSFSIVVQGDVARFLRWDPSGTVVTAAFNYYENPGLMADFLWRFDHLSPRQRGHDVSVQPADLAPEVDARVREQLRIQDRKIPLYQYEVPGLLSGRGFAYGPKPPTQNRSLVSRCTRNLPVVWIPSEDFKDDTRTRRSPDSGSERVKDQLADKDQEKLRPYRKDRLIYMKDTWRFLSNVPDAEVMPEHEIYDILYDHETPNIPQGVTGGDVKGGMTQAQELLHHEDPEAEWLCVDPRISPYQHYRLVHPIVGRPLFRFECTKQLVAAVYDAVIAHSHALNFAGFLHRDISVGNIILTDEGRGLLIDWELAKRVDQRGSRRHDRTGTWQFMSANLLWHPDKVHTLTDDLESFLHVLAWVMLRYVAAVDSYEPEDRRDDMAIFDQYSPRKGGLARGGHPKRSAFRGGSYPSETFNPRTPTPVLDLLRQLSSPFKSLYAVRPPTAEDRKKIDIPNSNYDEHLQDLSRDIRRYDRDIEQLQSHSFVIAAMEGALDENEWPKDDKAEENLLPADPRATRRQAQNWASQFQRTQSLWESSKALRGSSKRAASPTPERSAKRPRTPAASGSGT